MSLTLTLDSRGEQLIAAHLRSGQYDSPEELVNHALDALTDHETSAAAVKNMTPEEAVDDILELRRGLSLGGLRVKDMIDEGRKY